jgi:hypothetical protein
VVPGALSRRAQGLALKRAAIAVAVLLGAFFVVPLPARRTVPRLAEAIHGEGPLRAGAAQVPIALGEHPVLAGYAGRQVAARPLMPVYARALVIEAGTARALIASVDTLLIPPGLTVPGCALLVATHTHSGPGGLWDSFAAGLAGAGRYDEAQKNAVQAALDQAVRAATLALEPAQLLLARADWPQGPARPRSDGPIDTGIVALRLHGQTRPIATVLDYAMHPTSSSRDELSADWP